MNGINYLIYCVNYSNVKMFKNRIDGYLIKAGHTGYTLLHSSLSTCCYGLHSCK